jgi:NADH-ubiquinone oxidoreductase chain 5
MLLSFILSLIIFVEVGFCRSTCVINLFNLVQTFYFHIDISFLFDTITVVMLVVVTTISLFVHLFSVEYMGSDPHLIRFMSYLSLFTFFMLLLVTSGNLIQFFAGWEGVGLSSYLLINFWFTRKEANKASLKAIIVNRIGDCGLIIAICLAYIFFGTTDFYALFSVIGGVSLDLFTYSIPFKFSIVNLDEFTFAVKEMFSSIIYLDFCILFDEGNATWWLEEFFDRLISFWVDIVIILQYWFWLISTWWPAWGCTFWNYVTLELKHTVFSVEYFNYNKTSIFDCTYVLNINLLTVLCVFLIVAAAAKSAQLGLHTWLVDAMEGPTPVSALIHAATMVTAGVFLLVRVSPILCLCPISLKIILFVGSITALISSITAVFQVDIKKLIAYSTVSQIGFMFIACGSGNFNGAMFHLATHAFFKALLFLCAGVVIYILGDEQDMRKMGMLKSYVPFTFIVFMIGSLALAGFPFLSGFYSKDFILEFLYVKNSWLSFTCFCMAACAAFFTCVYSLKLAFFVFLIRYNGFRVKLNSLHEPGICMALSLSFLSLGSIFIGYLIRDLFIGMGTDFWSNSLVLNSLYVESRYIPLLIKLFPFLSFLIVLFFMYTQRFYYLLSMYDNIGKLFIFMPDWSILAFFDSIRIQFVSSLNSKNLLIKKGLSLREYFFFFFKNFLFDFFYNRKLVYPFMQSGYSFIFKYVDRGFIEKTIGPNGLVNYFYRFTFNILKLSDTIIFYSFIFSLGIIFSIFFSFLFKISIWSHVCFLLFCLFSLML